ncbi:hypothetical protein HYH02_001547 [Chlamydomonas schloesseri]|uniref:Uncharacterized protein n=1 Tax=Chlamydomonas schloesseri TaxID=2026947 RepID=A0A836BBG9_9CHLO|nr:hypothetical protein HYH02_001547 [Chlamydomonas schloesseri]|eukprot:KAG2453323.1 hypothetical protein HYH02_001547 [Chlamydomonas schloesseri]
MLLAIGDAHFGASTWSLTGAVAERNAVLSVGKARNMQGWDPLRDPLPIATLLRLAACRQRLDDSHTPQSQRSGFSTPTCSTTRDSCRRCSDCGSLSAVHSSEQPSCSQSEASWSLRSGCNGAQTGSAVCSPPLDAMTSSGSEEQPLSTASPASVASYDSLRGTGGSGSLAGLVDGTAAGGSHQGGAGSCQSIPEVASQEKQQQEVEGRVKPASSSPKAAQPGTQDGAAVAAGGRASGGSGGCSSKTCSGSGNTQSSAEAAAVAAAAAAAATAALQQRRLGKGAGRATCSALHLSAGAPQSAPSQLAATQSARGSLSNAPWMPRPALSATATSVSLQPHASVSSALPAMPAVPPSARDLLHRCATHLQLLFQWHPAQLSFAVPYLAEYLSAAPDVVAWGSGSPYFSLQGYAAAVYGSFEGLLVEVSRVFFGGCWRLEGGQAPGEPRVLCVPRCAHNVMLRSHHGSHGQPHHAHHQLASHGSATGSGLGSSRRASAASSGAASVSGGHHSSPHHHHHHSHRHHHQHQHGHGRSGYSYDQQSALASFASAKQLSRMGGGGGSSGITADGSAVQPACGVPPCVQRPLTTSRSAINLR